MYNFGDAVREVETHPDKRRIDVSSDRVSLSKLRWEARKSPRNTAFWDNPPKLEDGGWRRGCR